MPIKEETRIKIRSELYEVEASLFSDEVDAEEFFTRSEQVDLEADVMEINSMGVFSDDGERVSISYEESEATGMDGSQTAVTFLKNQPQIITMTRDGLVSATLVFEEGKRHHCIYKTPFMPFEVCVHTKKVVNRILDGGFVELDYVVEIRGAKAERTKFKMQLLK